MDAWFLRFGGKKFEKLKQKLVVKEKGQNSSSYVRTIIFHLTQICAIVLFLLSFYFGFISCCGPKIQL